MVCQACSRTRLCPTNAKASRAAVAVRPVIPDEAAVDTQRLIAGGAEESFDESAPVEGSGPGGQAGDELRD